MFRYSLNPCLERTLSNKHWFNNIPKAKKFGKASFLRYDKSKLTNITIASGQKAQIANSIRRDHMRRDRVMEVQRDVYIRTAGQLLSNKGGSAEEKRTAARAALTIAENLRRERLKQRSDHYSEAKAAKREHDRDRGRGGW